MKSDKIIERIREDFPKFRIVQKQDSRFWKLLGKINSRWLTDFSTTVGNSVYVSTRFQNLSELEKCAILVHEAIHLYDMKKDGKSYFYLKYCSPQILALASLLGFWEPIFFFCLFLLVPQTAIARSEYEFRAYAAGFFVYHFEGFFKRNSHLKDKFVDWINSQFSGSSYYWMYPNIKESFKNMIWNYESNFVFSSEFFENDELFSSDQLVFIKDVKKIMEQKE